MERFVFVAAVTFAVIFAFVAMVGKDHFSIEFDDEGGKADLVAAAPGRMAPQSFEGDSLVIKHTAARITITPEDRTDFAVEIDNPGKAPMPVVTVSHGDLRIDGQLSGRVEACRDGGGAALEGYGELALEELPQIIIHAPRTLNLSLGGASVTSIGPSEAMALDFSGCGSVAAGDVAGALEVELSGAGTVNAGAARSLELDSSGAGDFAAGAIGGDADIEVSGAGGASLASLAGDLVVESTGAGDVTVGGGAVTSATIDLSAAGDVSIGAPVQLLKVDIVGPGSVEVTATIGDLEAEIRGPGSVTVDAISGSNRQEIRGPGRVNVGR